MIFVTQTNLGPCRKRKHEILRMQYPSNFNAVIQSVFESLEERVLFDGVPDAAFIVQENVDGAPTAQFQHQQQTDSQAPIELIIIDAGVQDLSLIHI